MPMPGLLGFGDSGFEREAEVTHTARPEPEHFLNHPDTSLKQYQLRKLYST
jgi:hypothetical protein